MTWAETVGIACRRERDVPVGVQLEWGLRAAVLGGRLSAGDRLPTLRDLAEDVGVNSNTVRAVYARLERDGLIETRHGSGSFVLPQPAGAHLGLAEALTRAGRAAAETGLTAEQLAAALYVTPDAGARLSAEKIRRRELRAQVAVLEQVLSDFYTSHPGLPVETRPRARPLGPKILSTKELQAQREELVALLADAYTRAVAEPEPAQKAATAAKPAPRRTRPQGSAAAAGPSPRSTPRIAPA